MDVNQIRALAEILNQTGLTRLDVSEGDLTIRLEKQAQSPAASPVPPLPPTAAVAVVSPEAQAAVEPVDFNRVTEVKSPMVGVFYAAPGPEAQPFVSRGSRVKKGDVLCIIEAMKLLNEITAEADGEIADICVENGQVVEFSQTLFKIC